MESLGSDYPEDTGQSLSQWMYEWEQMEKERIRKAQENGAEWLKTVDQSKWTIKTEDDYARIWKPWYTDEHPKY